MHRLARKAGAAWAAAGAAAEAAAGRQQRQGWTVVSWPAAGESQQQKQQQAGGPLRITRGLWPPAFSPSSAARRLGGSPPAVRTVVLCSVIVLLALATASCLDGRRWLRNDDVRWGRATVTASLAGLVTALGIVRLTAGPGRTASAGVGGVPAPTLLLALLFLVLLTAADAAKSTAGKERIVQFKPSRAAGSPAAGGPGRGAEEDGPGVPEYDIDLSDQAQRKEGRETGLERSVCCAYMPPMQTGESVAAYREGLWGAEFICTVYNLCVTS